MRLGTSIFLKVRGWATRDFSIFAPLSLMKCQFDNYKRELILSSHRRWHALWGWRHVILLFAMTGDNALRLSKFGVAEGMRRSIRSDGTRGACGNMKHVHVDCEQSNQRVWRFQFSRILTPAWDCWGETLQAPRASSIGAPENEACSRVYCIKENLLWVL